MAFLGRLNRLKVIKIADHGVYLDASWMGEVLLPKRQVPNDCKPGDYISVFLYLDSEDRYIATTTRPFAQVGEVAFLKVEEVNKFGAFLDWGLPKQLLAPFKEQHQNLEAGRSYVVYIYTDDTTNRIAASTKLNKFISKNNKELTEGDAAKLTVTELTDLGYMCAINNKYWGLLFYSDVVKPLKIGQNINGYIKKKRKDGKVDLSLQAPGFAKVEDLSKRILRELENKNGFLPLSDKSAPEQIYEAFGVSKKAFKMTIGNLYKKRLIRIEKNGIRLC